MKESHQWTLYIHKNKTNNKRYIGITSQQPEKRWLNGHGYAKHLPIGKAIEKYGWDGFEHIVIYNELSEKQAKEFEVLFIEHFDTTNPQKGYNLTIGGDGVRGFKASSETKLKMSLAKSGASHPNYGKHLDDDVKKKISSGLKGNKNAVGAIRSEETKLKISHSKYKPVAMYEGDTLIKVFDSAKEAGEIIGINRKNISLCCYGKRKHAGGYAWKFA